MSTESQAASVENPRVTIGVPVYNGERYLAHAIEAVLAQDFQDWELVISDNCSTDGTEGLCRSYAEKDDRIRYYRASENKGAAANYNRVFELARGEFFKWAAHDDVCEPQFISRCVEALDAAPGAVVAYPRSHFIDQDGKVCGKDPDDMRVQGGVFRRVRRCIATVNRAGPVFGLIRSSALRKTRLIDTFISSDYVLIAEMAMLGEFVQLEEVLFLRRIHSGSSRLANRTDDEVAAWFDPHNNAKRRLTVRQKLMLEYIRSARRLVTPAHQRVLCVAAIPTTMAIRRVRVVGGRWKRKLRQRLARTDGNASRPIDSRGESG